MKRYLAVALSLVLFAFTSTSAMAALEIAKKIESFDFLVDNANGMQGKKIDQAKTALYRVNERIPSLNYRQSGLHQFSPVSTLLEYVPYDRNTLKKAIDNIGSMRSGLSTADVRPSHVGSGIVGASNDISLGVALNYFDPAYSNLLRKGALIVVTDGIYSEGRDAYNEAKVFYLTQPDICLHFISVADTERGQQLINKMSLMHQCSVSVKAADLIGNDRAVEDFVEKVFYTRVEKPAPVPVAPVEPVIAPIVVPPVDEYNLTDVDNFSIPFAFDSDKLDNHTVKVLNAVVKKMRDNPSYKLHIDGYTCSMGSVPYNLNLSQRRANTARNYIIKEGIADSRMTTKGHGKENPQYDNNTLEGRKLNRRVNFTFSR